MAAAYRGLSSDLDVLHTVYTPFAGQPRQDSEEEEDSENDEAPPQRFAGGGATDIAAAGMPRRANTIQAS